jgi:hypothetical protein
LSWRKNDEDPFAAWKIVIIVNSATSQKKDFTYNVRKSVLADGPRRSEYFVRLFENDGNFAEAHDKTSRIENCGTWLNPKRLLMFKRPPPPLLLPPSPPTIYLVHICTRRAARVFHRSKQHVTEKSLSSHSLHVCFIIYNG